MGNEAQRKNERKTMKISTLFALAAATAIAGITHLNAAAPLLSPRAQTLVPPTIAGITEGKLDRRVTSQSPRLKDQQVQFVAGKFNNPDLLAKYRLASAPPRSL